MKMKEPKSAYSSLFYAVSGILMILMVGPRASAFAFSSGFLALSSFMYHGYEGERRDFHGIWQKMDEDSMYLVLSSGIFLVLSYYPGIVPEDYTFFFAFAPVLLLAIVFGVFYLDMNSKVWVPIFSVILLAVCLPLNWWLTLIGGVVAFLGYVMRQYGDRRLKKGYGNLHDSYHAYWHIWTASAFSIIVFIIR